MTSIAYFTGGPSDKKIHEVPVLLDTFTTRKENAPICMEGQTLEDHAYHLKSTVESNGVTIGFYEY